MKFTNNFKLCIALMYIYFSLFTEIYTLHSELQIQRFRRYMAAMRYQRAHTNYPFKTPLANFASGIAEELAEGDTGFFQCFPESWRNPNHKDSDDPTSDAGSDGGNDTGSDGGNDAGNDGGNDAGNDGGNDNGGNDDSNNPPPADGDSQGDDGYMDDGDLEGESTETSTTTETVEGSEQNGGSESVERSESNESENTSDNNVEPIDPPEDRPSVGSKISKRVTRKSEKKVHNTGVQMKVVENNFGSWVDGLEKFANLAGNVIDFFCQNRMTVIKFLQKSFLSRKLRKYRAMVESGNGMRAIALLRRKFGWGWFKRFTRGISNFARNTWKRVKRSIKRVGGAIGNAIKRASNFVKEKAQAAGNWIKNRVLMPIFNRFIKPIRDQVMGFVEKIKKFFTGGIIARIQTCVESVKAGIQNVQTVFEGLKEKFDTLRTAISLGLPGIIIFIFDFVIALVCEYKSLLKGIKQLVAGVKSPDKNQKFWLMGKALGTFLRTLATAQTFSGTILSKMRGRKSLF